MARQLMSEMKRKSPSVRYLNICPQWHGVSHIRGNFIGLLVNMFGSKDPGFFSLVDAKNCKLVKCHSMYLSILIMLIYNTQPLGLSHCLQRFNIPRKFYTFCDDEYLKT